MGDLSLAKYVAFSHELSKSYCEIPVVAQVCWKRKYQIRILSWFRNEIVLVPAFLDKIRFSTCNRPGMRIHLQKTFDPLWCPPLMPHQNGLKSLPKELSNFQATAFSRNIPFLFIILQHLWKFYKYILWKKTNTGGWIIEYKNAVSAKFCPIVAQPRKALFLLWWSGYHHYSVSIGITLPRLIMTYHGEREIW